MDKQRTVNTVTANDEWSQSLMKMYENWMGGDTFQNSTIEEEEIPTGQKQGGGSGAAFKTAIGELPGVEFDKSSGLPTIPELGVSDKTEKNTAQTDSANQGEPAVALKGSMTMGQGSLSSGQKQSHGQEIAYTNVVAKEGKTEATTCKKCGGYHATEECTATKEEVETYLRSESERILTELSELTQTTYTVTAEAWDVKEPQVDITDTEEWKEHAKKQTAKVMDMWKEGKKYGKKKKDC